MQTEEEKFWLQPQARVRLKIEPETMGTVLSVDLDCYPLEVYGVTTAKVLWDDAEGEVDIQWSNKLELVNRPLAKVSGDRKICVERKFIIINTSNQIKS